MDETAPLVWGTVAEGAAGVTVFSAEVACAGVLEFLTGVFWLWLAGVTGVDAGAASGE